MSGFFRLIGMVAVLCMTPVTGIQFTMTRNQVALGNPSGTDPVLTMTCTTAVTKDLLFFKIKRETVDGGDWQPIASFTSGGGAITTDLPSYWTSANITGSVQGSKSLMISVQASSLTCDDDRTYQCEVSYLNEQINTVTEVQNSTLTITAAPSPPTLTARNWNTNTPINTGFNQDTPASMAIGEQVELTCEANIGSDSSRTIRWQKSSEVNAGQMIDYTTNKNDGTAVQNSGSNHCTYSRTSTIRYNTTVVDSKRNEQLGLRFSCFFIENQQDTQQMFYIQVAGGSDNTDTSVDNAGVGGTNVGAIVGGVIGGLIAIIIIIVVVWFIWFRSGSGDTYKTKEEYGSENPNMAPAPSDLYATPNKPKHRRGHENRGLDEPHESNSRRHDDYNGRGRANFGMRGDDDEFDHYDSRDGSPTLTDKGISHMGVDPVNLSIGTGV